MKKLLLKLLHLLNLSDTFYNVNITNKNIYKIRDILFVASAQFKLNKGYCTLVL